MHLNMFSSVVVMSDLLGEVVDLVVDVDLLVGLGSEGVQLLLIEDHILAFSYLDGTSHVAPWYYLLVQRTHSLIFKGTRIVFSDEFEAEALIFDHSVEFDWYVNKSDAYSATPDASATGISG